MSDTVIKTIPTAAGDAIHWGIVDALSTFRLELEMADIIQAGDPDVWECQYRAWQSLSAASYIIDPTPWEASCIQSN